MESSTPVPLRGLTAPFGMLGLAAAVYGASLMIPDGCTLSAADATRGQHEVLVAVPLALMLVAWAVERATTWRVLRVTLLTPILLSVTVGTPFIVTGGVEGVFFGWLLLAMLFLPIGAAWLCMVRLTVASDRARADDPPDVQRFFAIDRWLRVAAGVASSGWGASLVVWTDRHTPVAVPPYSWIGGALAVVALAAFIGLQQLRRDAIVLKPDAQAPVADGGGYRAADVDPTAARRKAVRHEVRSDALDLVVVSVLALSASVGFFMAQAPPPPPPPGTGAHNIQWPSVD